MSKFPNTPGIWWKLLALSLTFLPVPGRLLLGGESDPQKLLIEADRLAWLKNWTRAEPLFAEAEQLFNRQGDRRNELYSRIGKLRGQLPRMPNAELSQTLSELLADPLVRSDQKLRLRCLVVKGDTDMDMDAALAERDWTEALAIATSIGDKGWIVRANGELGILAFLNGDSGGAMMKIGMALRQAQETGDLGAEIRYLTLIGEGMAEFGRAEQALNYFDKALVAALRDKDLQSPLLTYSSKATALVALGRSSEAKQLLDQALEVATRRNAIGYQAELYVQLGLLAKKAGQPKEAILRFEDAARIAESAQAWRTISQARYEISKLREAEGNLAAAEEAAKQCVAMCRRVTDRFYLPRYLAREAEIQLKRGRIREAEATYAEAKDLINGNLVNVSSVWTKSSLIGVMNEVFLGHFRTEAQFSHNPKVAFRVVEEARGRPITDMLLAREQSRRVQPAELSASERQISRLQIDLQKTTVRRERQRILDRLLDAELAMAPVSTSADRWMRIATKPVALEELQRRLQPGEAVLEYVLDEPTSYCLVISRSSARLRKLAGKGEVGRVVTQLTTGIRANGKIEVPARRLHELVLTPLEQDLTGTGRLIVVPDGSLHQVPFELLVDVAGKLVLQTRTLSYSPSGSVLALVRAKTLTQGGKHPLLAVSYSPPDNIAPLKPAGGGVYDINRGELKPLPAANGEVRDAIQIFGGKSVALMDATESQVKAQPLQDFAVLHFAAHAVTSTKFPERSTLVLRSDEARQEDGLLQAREILRWRLNADVVTLATCDGLSGNIAGQEGVSSLARPFLVAGARSIVANLWSASDDFSRSLMKQFYIRLAVGQDVASALRQAKLDMIERFGSNATPYLWGGYIVLGDGAGKLRYGR